ncbi:Spermidine synthase [hydrothermal vent metagenome]|uniref:Spermidine synthase n=1 Tax=hydrothermal vent metagenome TaxID=652676 RepID=A0A1W1D3N6_9ZZZZ
MNQSIYAEMMVHVPLCTNKDPHDILILSNEGANLLSEIEKHNDDIKATILDATLERLREGEDGAYDVIICEIQNADSAVIAHINRTLKADGLVVMQHPLLKDVKANKTLMQELGKYFKIIMPYNLGNGATALLASKEYHPTADIILQRSDLLDNLNVYNCDLHIASFAMPNYIRKEYLGIIRN